MKTKLLFKTLIFAILIFDIFLNTNAQGWEKTFGGTNSDNGQSIIQTLDGGYLIFGYTNSFGAGDADYYLIKTDVNGDTIWTRRYGGSSTEFGYSICQTNDGNYAVAGQSYSFGAGNGDAYLIKINANGNVINTKAIGGTSYDHASFIDQTNDGGFIITGGTSSFGYGTVGDIYLIKTDANFDTLWTKTFGWLYNDAGKEIVQTSDNGYIIAGHKQLSNGGTTDIYIIKTNANGESLWSKLYGGNNSDYASSIQSTSDGGYIIGGSTQSFGADNRDIYLLKINANGDTLWTKTFGGINNDFGASVKQTIDGGYIVFGSYGVTSTNSDLYLMKTDANGILLWSKTYGGLNSESGYSVKQTSDGGFILVGTTASFGAGNGDVYLIKTDSLGNSLTNRISGYLFNDINNDCIKDANEFGICNKIVKILPGPKYAITDSTGFYSLLTDSGTYTISVPDPPLYWSQTCPILPNTYTVNFTSNNHLISANNNFANVITTFCPHLWIDISTGFIRSCRTNIYSVNYCNNGTVTAINAYIEIKFDTSIIVLNSTLPWNNQNGNTFTFNLGSINPGQCGNFYITDSVSCNTPLFSAVCVEAIIYPDSICTPVDTAWDKSSISVTGKCMYDSLACFTIHNNGLSMTSISQYRIYVNNVLVITQSFQLNTGDSLVVCYTANGNTIRFEADQRPGHPGHSHPKKIIEGCGTPSVYGNVTTVAQDDANDNKDIDCRIDIGSLDPNEKFVQPEGITSNKYISSSDELEYNINFQNTGNDTAFLVVIRDTLSQYLNPATVISGASSHSYSFRVYGQGILEWKFNNIMLPDSNINESASHGFVKFNVKQKSNNPKGSIIQNSAAIYFDYNAPVITNEVWNMVYDTTLISFSKPIIYDNKIVINVYPNPFSKSTTIEIKSLICNYKSPINFVMYDLLGREVKNLKFSNYKLQIDRNDLPNGMYFYYVNSENKNIGAGKIIIE